MAEKRWILEETEDFIWRITLLEWFWECEGMVYSHRFLDKLRRWIEHFFGSFIEEFFISLFYGLKKTWKLMEFR